MKSADFDKKLTSFKNYYEANISPLTMFAKRFVPEDTAEDIIQDLFLDIWDNKSLYHELPNRSYLFKAVRNKCLNILTREQVKNNYVESIELEIKLLGLEYYSSDEKILIQEEEIQHIYAEIDTLPEKCREVFKMSYLEEKNNAEIAEQLNISIRTVEHHLYLGLKELRTRLNSKDKKSLFFMLFL